MNKMVKNLIILSATSLIIFAILSLLILFGIIDEYNAQILTVAGMYCIVALSLNLITGFTGQLALGQAGFMCVGAYTTAIAMMKLGIPLFAAIIFGGLVAAVFGIIIGFPTLRMRGDYLAIATLAFGEIIRVLMVNLGDLTGGASGLKGIPSFSNTGNFIYDAIIKFAWVFGFVIITLFIISNLIKSSHGRAIISIREDEIASNSMGVNGAYFKMFSFTISSFLAGMGGGLYAIYFGYLNPDMFRFMNSVNFVVIVVLGGMGSITGTVISAVGFTYIQEWLRVFKDFRLVIFGLALIAVMLFWPRGLMGTREFSIVGFVGKVRSGEITVKTIAQSINRFLLSIGRLFTGIFKKKGNSPDNGGEVR